MVGKGSARRSTLGSVCAFHGCLFAGFVILGATGVSDTTLYCIWRDESCQTADGRRGGDEPGVSAIGNDSVVIGLGYRGDELEDRRFACAPTRLRLTWWR
jgi:hypothetical protein